MKQHISFDPVEGVSIAIVPDNAAEATEDSVPVWTVYLLNSNDTPLENVLIAADGYGTQPTGVADCGATCAKW